MIGKTGNELGEIINEMSVYDSKGMIKSPNLIT